MAKIKFRTADGRTVTFSSSTRRNPSWSPRYRGRKGSISAKGDAQDRRRSAAKKATKKSVTKQSKKIGGKYNVYRSSSTIKVTQPGFSAQHRYANVAAAKAAYSRLTSMKAADAFIARYGKAKRTTSKRSTSKKTVTGSGWVKRRSCNGKTYYVRCNNGRTEMKWGANGKIIRLAAPFKKGGGRRKGCAAPKKRGSLHPGRGTCPIPKGKSKGQTFTRAGIKYRIQTRKTKNGGYKRIAVKVK